MFTGLIEEVGIVDKVQILGISGNIVIHAKKILEGTEIGDSIAVNGVCLTVVALHEQGFTADVMAETLRRSSLGELKKGSAVNLERAMAADGRFGGHIVSGHIDGTGKIVDRRQEGNAIWITIQAESAILRLIVEKGSIAIDGISLTIAGVNDAEFQVSVIPHTGAHTTLLDKGVGELVNLENDVVAKYVERLLVFSEKKEKKSRVTEDFLKEYGFYA